MDVDGSSKGGGVWWPPTEKSEILGSEKCILVDSGDGFAMDNRERKNVCLVEKTKIHQIEKLSPSSFKVIGLKRSKIGYV